MWCQLSIATSSQTSQQSLGLLGFCVTSERDARLGNPWQELLDRPQKGTYMPERMSSQPASRSAHTHIEKKGLTPRAATTVMAPTDGGGGGGVYVRDERWCCRCVIQSEGRRVAHSLTPTTMLWLPPHLNRRATGPGGEAVKHISHTRFHMRKKDVKEKTDGPCVVRVKKVTLVKVRSHI